MPTMRVWPDRQTTDPRLTDADVYKLRFTGPYGWADYSDEAVGTPLVLPARVSVQVNRPLSPAPRNNVLTGPYVDHDFWQGSPDDMRIVPRAAGDVLLFGFFASIRPEIEDGEIRLDLDVGGAIGSIGAVSYAFTVPAGVVEDLRFPPLPVPVRNAFLTNGARVMLTSTVPAELLEFSPEFFPLSVPEPIDG